MKLHPVPKEYGTPFALHIANRKLILTIVEMGDQKIWMGGIPALLTNGVSWFSAELIEDPKEVLFVAAAVNMYGAKAEAKRQAENRGERGQA